MSAKIALIGESAGGFLVNYAGTHETPETKVRAVVDLYGPVDYGKLAEERRDHPERFNMTSINRHASNGGGIHFFGAEQLDAAGLAKLRAISPIFAVHKGMAPFLCIHGTKDDQVSYDQSPAMCDAMKKVGASCELISDRRRRPRHERLEGARNAALEAGNDRLAKNHPPSPIKHPHPFAANVRIPCIRGLSFGIHVHSWRTPARWNLRSRSRPSASHRRLMFASRASVAIFGIHVHSWLTPARWNLRSHSRPSASIRG